MVWSPLYNSVSHDNAKPHGVRWRCLGISVWFAGIQCCRQLFFIKLVTQCWIPSGQTYDSESQERIKQRVDRRHWPTDICGVLLKSLQVLETLHTHTRTSYRFCFENCTSAYRRRWDKKSGQYGPTRLGAEPNMHTSRDWLGGGKTNLDLACWQWWAWQIIRVAHHLREKLSNVRVYFSFC